MERRDSSLSLSSSIGPSHFCRGWQVYLYTIYYAPQRLICLCDALVLRMCVIYRVESARYNDFVFSYSYIITFFFLELNDLAV